MNNLVGRFIINRVGDYGLILSVAKSRFTITKDECYLVKILYHGEISTVRYQEQSLMRKLL